jgi:hypothetical protein
VPARGGVNRGSNRWLESLGCTPGRVRYCRAHAWGRCRASTGSIARVLGRFVRCQVLSVKKQGVFTALRGGFASRRRTRRDWAPRDVSQVFGTARGRRIMLALATYRTAAIPARTKFPEFPLLRRCPNFRKRCRHNSIAPNALSILAARALRRRRCAHLATSDNCRTASCLPASRKLRIVCHTRQRWPKTATN